MWYNKEKYVEGLPKMTMVNFLSVLEVIATRLDGRVEEIDTHISFFIGNHEYSAEISDINNLLENI